MHTKIFLLNLVLKLKRTYDVLHLDRFIQTVNYHSTKVGLHTFEFSVGTIHSSTLTITFTWTIGILWTSIFLGNGVVSCK